MPKQGKRVPDSMKAAIGELCMGPNGPGLPQLSELAEHFIRLRGGPFKVARMLSDEWDNTKAGSIARTRILDMLLRVWKVGNDQVKGVDDLGLLSQDDLDALLKAKLADIQGPAGEPSGENDEPSEGAAP